MSEIDFEKDFNNEFNNIKRLYHYTTIETLLKIIESQTLRFNRNDKVNDVIEHGRTKDSYIDYYTSCFTYEEKESIPLWYIYAGKENGVRISVKNEDFISNKVFCWLESKQTFFEYRAHGSDKNGLLYRNVIKVKNGYTGLSDFIKVKVMYDDEHLKTNPTVIDDRGAIEFRSTNVYQMAGLKSTAWEYEKEARIFVTMNNDHHDIDSLYFELKDSFFENMVITLNPFISEIEGKDVKAKLKNAASRYKITFQDSTLKGLIR